MRLWMALYAMIWIAFLEFLLAMTPAADPTLLLYGHGTLGIAIVGIAFYNFNGLRQTRAPGRVKRVAKSTLQLSVLMGVLGALLFADVGADWIIPGINLSVYALILFFHVVNAFAVITQSAAVAIAHDMWEDREFEKETEPGAIPELPRPAAASPPRA